MADMHRRQNCVIPEDPTCEQDPTVTVDDPSTGTAFTMRNTETATENNDSGPERTETPNPLVGGATTPTTAATVIQTKPPDNNAAETVVATSTPVASSRGGGGGVSKGAVAGIAIGTAIAGAAIAFLVAFLLFKRRKRNTNASLRTAYDSTPELVALSKAGPSPYVSQHAVPIPPVAAAAIPPPTNTDRNLNVANLSNSSDFLTAVLPPAADEQTVRTKVVALFTVIQRHVDNFYRDVPASITPSMEADLARFGMGDAGMVELLQGTSMPTLAIRHALVGYILSITSAEKEDEETLFPNEVKGVKVQRNAPGSPDLSPPYILYRRLSVFLHNASSPTPSPSQSSDVREAAEHFALTFFPWANPTYGDQERDEDLVRIVGQALELSVWLYGQPYLYEWVWEGVGRRGTVVQPSLVRVSDERGRVGERSVVLDAVVASL